MEKNISRFIPLEKALKKGSVLLLGPRRTGKSWLIKNQIKPDRSYNLLRSDTFQMLSHRPSLIREQLEKTDKLIAIDEIQKLPILMDEVHSMIEDMNVRFLLTGSSARKLRRTHTSLMAGRAKTMHLFGFTTEELNHEYKLMRILKYGTLPPVIFTDDPEEILSTYVGDYLREEIQAEALTRRIENFSRFLNHAAKFNTEQINFESVASDAQVPARTIREYYHLLEDTLIGTSLQPLQTQGKRKAVSHAKFYFFDIGVVNALLGTFDINEIHPLFGKNFEHFIFCELRSYMSYLHPRKSIHFWRTQSQDKLEVDFILNGDIAIEVKATQMVSERDLKGLKALSEETKLKRKIVVSRDPHKRKLNDIEIWPYQSFLKALWGGKIV